MTNKSKELYDLSGAYLDENEPKIAARRITDDVSLTRLELELIMEGFARSLQSSQAEAKLPKMSQVSRSTFMLKVNENLRLLKDLDLLTNNNPSLEKVACVVKWQNHFKKAKEGDWITKLLNEARKA